MASDEILRRGGVDPSKTSRAALAARHRSEAEAGEARVRAERLAHQEARDRMAAEAEARGEFPPPGYARSFE